MTKQEQLQEARTIGTKLIGRSVYEQDEIIAAALAEHDRKTLDLMRTMVGRRPSKRVVYCSDCGEQGHSKGYMTCQYPQN